jgi:hypothetical protein
VRATPIVYTIEIPGLKIESVANLREHWRTKAARVAEQRHLVTIALRAAHLSRDYVDALKLDMLTRARVTLTRRAPRLLDSDNLSSGCKATRDAVAEILGLDDRSPRYTWCYAQENTARKAGEKHRAGTAGALGLRIEIELS